MRNLYGYAGLALFLAGIYLLLGLPMTLLTIGLVLMWMAIRMDEGNATDT